MIKCVWLLVALAVCSFSKTVLAEPLHLNPTGCKFYAKDANHMALTRDAGVSEEDAVEYWEGHQYDPDVKPYLIELIHFIYKSSLTPEEASVSLYAECLHNEGWIGPRTKAEKDE